MLFQIFLHHEAAHRVANQYRRRGQSGGNRGYVIDIIVDGKHIQPLAAGRCAVAGQA